MLRSTYTALVRAMLASSPSWRTAGCLLEPGEAQTGGDGAHEGGGLMTGTPVESGVCLCARLLWQIESNSDSFQCTAEKGVNAILHAPIAVLSQEKHEKTCAKINHPPQRTQPAASPTDAAVPHAPTAELLLPWRLLCLCRMGDWLFCCHSRHCADHSHCVDDRCRAIACLPYQLLLF